MTGELRMDARGITVKEEARFLPVAASPQVLVLGGGVAGLAAAIAASRTGAYTLLIEPGNYLGGTTAAGMMALFYRPYRCAHGIPKAIFDRLIAACGAFPGEVISVDPEIFKGVAFEMATEAGSPSCCIPSAPTSFWTIATSAGK